MCCEIMSCSDSSGRVTHGVSLEEPSPLGRRGSWRARASARGRGLCWQAGGVVDGGDGVGGPWLRLALLHFDSLGFDGSGACWLGLAR